MSADAVLLERLARRLRLERQGQRAVRALAGAGVDCLLLKGPVTAQWLYPGAPRVFVDIDLLVPPQEFLRAEQVLAGLGHHPRTPGHLLPPEVSPTERHLVGEDGVLDLHRRLLGVPEEREQVAWDLLWAQREPFPRWAGAWCLSVVPRLAHLALHVAQGGPADRNAVQDLRLGLAAHPASEWAAAAAFAVHLGAAEAFASGLCVLPEGAVLAGDLGLAASRSRELRLRAASASDEALALERVAQARGWRARCRLTRHHLTPDLDALAAARASEHPRRRSAGLYAANALDVLRRTPAAVREWRRAREG